MAEQAENSAGSKMATLITKSNTMRRQAKEKQEELKRENGQIEDKLSELKKI